MHLQKNGIKDKYQIASIIQNRHMDMSAGLVDIVANGQVILNIGNIYNIK